MRALSLTMRQALNAQESGEVAIVLLTIQHPDLPTPIRLSSDPTTLLTDTPLQYGTVSRGYTFRFFPFVISLPDDVSERSPTAQIQIENVSRELVSIVRSTSTPATVWMQMVLASNPSFVEIDYPLFDLRSVSYTASVMTLELSIDSLATEPYPSGNFDPAGFPGMFG